MRDQVRSAPDSPLPPPRYARGRSDQAIGTGDPFGPAAPVTEAGIA